MRDGAGLQWGEVHWARVDTSSLACYPMRIEWELQSGLRVVAEHEHWPEPEVPARPWLAGDPIPPAAYRFFELLERELDGRVRLHYARGTSMSRGKPAEVVDSIAVRAWSDVGAAAAVWLGSEFKGAWVRSPGRHPVRVELYALTSVHQETGRRRRESGPNTMLGWLKGQRELRAENR